MLDEGVCLIVLAAEDYFDLLDGYALSWVLDKYVECLIELMEVSFLGIGEVYIVGIDEVHA